LQNYLSVHHWLEKHDLQDYTTALAKLGFNDIESIKDNLDAKTLERITNDKPSKMLRFKHALKKLRGETDGQRSFLGVLFYPIYACVQVVWFFLWMLWKIGKS